MTEAAGGVSSGGNAPAAHVVMTGVTKRFAHAVANDDASLEVRPGEIHALVGENGAGKSTLMHILYGLIRPDAGAIRVGDAVGPFAGPREAIRAGVGMVHQHFMLVGPMSVTENVFLGAEPVRSGLLRWPDARDALVRIAREHRFDIDPDAPVDALGVGAQQRVEILKVLAREARVLILDEPTAVLTPEESDALFRVLRSLRDGGASVIVITHRLEEVMSAADRVTVMRRGRTIATHAVRDTSTDQLAEEMVGHALEVGAAPAPVAKDAPATLRLEAVSARGPRGESALEDVSLEIRSGEVLGVAGVEGNGQTELAEIVAGLARPTGGRVLLGGDDVTRLSRARRLRSGVAFVPEDRLDRGIVKDFSLAENLVIGRQRDPELSRRGVVARAALMAHARERLEAFDVRPPAPDVRAAALSGGNQQKVIMARELSGAPRVLVAAQPTRGVDVGAIQSIHARIRDAAADGAAVLLISAELEELLALSHRLIVLYRGRIAGETPRADADVRTLGRWMLGGDAA